jgi:glutaredoxin
MAFEPKGVLTVYSKANCPKCVQLKGQLDMVGIAYQEIRVDQDPGAHKFLVERGHRSVPQMYNWKDAEATYVGFEFKDVKGV